MNFEINHHVLLIGKPAFIFPSSSDTLTVDRLTLVLSQDSIGTVISQTDGNTLLNHGEIVETDTIAGKLDDAVVFSANNGFILNAHDGGVIVGGHDGIRCSGSGNIVRNFNWLVGEGGFGLDFDAHATHNGLANFGDITGPVAGAAITGGDGIYNHGRLHASVVGDEGQITGVGVLVTASSPGSALIVNSAAGVIESGIRALGPLSLNNSGEVIGEVNCGSVTGRDLIVNHGTITGPVVLGLGNDYFDGRDGTAPQIYAGTGNDQIMVGKGDVIIGVGRGYNTLTCGTGADTFMFNTPLTGQFDKIIGFTVGLDKILLWSNVFLGVTGPLNETSVLDPTFFHVGSHAETAAEHILYNGDNGFLSYDADGSGPAAPIHFATISPHLQLTAADFLLAD